MLAFLAVSEAIVIILRCVLNLPLTFVVFVHTQPPADVLCSMKLK